MIARRFAAGLALLLGAGFATAQTGPQLLTTFPPGAKAGDTVEVTFAGVGFDGDEKLLFSGKGFKAEAVGTATVDPKASKGGKGMAGPSAAVKFKVTAPKDAGTYDVRVVSKSGLSNPRTFVVGDLKEVNEAEPNNDVGLAQKIELNTTVNGVISAPTDVDYVSFTAKAGQNVVVYCLTTSIDSRLSADLLAATPDGKPLAANRGYREGDAVLDFKAPADGEYVVRVAQFAYTTGGSDHFYRLTVTTGPWVDAMWPPLVGTGKGWIEYGRNLGETKAGSPHAFPRPDGRLWDSARVMDHVQVIRNKLSTTRPLPPSAAMVDGIDLGRGPDRNLLLVSTGASVLDNEDNDTADKAQPVVLPCDIAGRIEKKNDRDWYTFEGRKGDVWTIDLFADRIGSQMDAYFILTDSKGKVITEQDDSADTLSPNQFYTKSDDPGRYKFTVPADGGYRVMVSSREAGIQFGVREQYVLRIAKENPDFRLAIMPITPHLPDAGTLPKGGAALFSVFVFRMDGFDGPITLTADKLPPGVECPTQVIGTGQTRGSLVLLADKDAEDWEGFVTITATSDKLRHTARPFTVVWQVPGQQANQPPPNTPMITRMDRGDGMALAVRGDAPFTLAPTEKEFTVKPGGKIDVTLKVTRDAKFKDGIQVSSAVPGFGPRQQGNNPVPPLATAAADKSEVKVSVDVQQNTPPGTYTLVLAGKSATPPPKGGNNAPQRVQPSYPALPVTVVVEGTPKKK